ncbi:hypothetical protein BCR44DRAFT_59963 [Catenaria anguillulae PL171]|uniref:Cytoplasmic tRNA 2-thiolation protein 1 n=1 Tax=Catenaria anguillulae PL171 TaxID=765915 RepID=A0A1Y2HUP7_9FUNG|nr:hypothetical protein BCR44DRAFT_59963 [Catenaria anguillulae PL171]
MPQCQTCHTARASLKRPKTGAHICKACFYLAFETEIHTTITSNKLFHRGERVAIGASGGKDSTVLAYVLRTLNDRYDYGLDLVLLSVDEGITGYRDDSLATVRRNMEQYGLPLLVVSYKDMYGWSMDDIVKQVGLKNNCTFCGVFRRQALDRGAVKLGVDHIVTGHNADDIAETVLMNILRGDFPRLTRCTAITTQSDPQALKRSKPFKYTYEKEIVMYAYFKQLDYFSTECTYAPQAYRGYARTYLKDLEALRPSAILDIIASGEAFAGRDQSAVSGHVDDDEGPSCGQVSGGSNQDKVQSKATNKNKSKKKDVPQAPGECERCGYMSSQKVCKACVLLEGLNRGLPTLGIGKTETMRRKHGLTDQDSESVGRTIEHMADLQKSAGQARTQMEGPVRPVVDAVADGVQSLTLRGALAEL